MAVVSDSGSRQTLDERLRVLEDTRVKAAGTPERAEACRVCYTLRDGATTDCVCGRALWLPIELVIIELTLTLLLADSETELTTQGT